MKSHFLPSILLATAGMASAQLPPTGYLSDGREMSLPVSSLTETSFAGRLAKARTNVDLTADFPPPGDQGGLGSCVAWSVGYGLRSGQINRELGWGFASNDHLISPAFIYKNIHLNSSSGGGGAYVADAFNLIKNTGASTLSTTPYEAYNWNVAITSAAMQEATKYKVSGWGRISNGDAAQMKLHISNGQGVVLGSVPVYPDFDNISSTNEVYNSISGSSRGKHAILLVGWDDAKQAFKFLNSWGAYWGIGGYGWISYSLVQALKLPGFVSQHPGVNPLQGFSITWGINGYDLKSSRDIVTAFDYDGDKKSDYIMYRPGDGAVYIQKSLGAGSFTQVYASGSGIGGFDMRSTSDRVIPLDYNGDGKQDLMLVRPGSGAAWIVRSNGDGSFTTVYSSMGGIGGFDLKSGYDRVVPLDFNGDGKQDLLLSRPGSKAFWLVRSNGDGTFTTIFSSMSGVGGFDLASTKDKIVVLDHDGDKRDDFLVYRPGAGAIAIFKSGLTGLPTQVYFSMSGLNGYDLKSASDIIMPIRHAAEGRDGLILYRPGAGAFWGLYSNGDNTFRTVHSGLGGVAGFDLKSGNDRIVTTDFNGDKYTDLILYRAGSGVVWFAQGGPAGFTHRSHSVTGIGGFDFKSMSDVVFSSDIDGNGMMDFTVYRPGSGAIQPTWF